MTTRKLTRSVAERLFWAVIIAAVLASLLASGGPAELAQGVAHQLADTWTGLSDLVSALWTAIAPWRS